MFSVKRLTTTTLSVRNSVRRTGANPTNPSYNASAVKIYNAISRLLRFENKIFFLYVLWKTLCVDYYNTGVVVVNFEVVGLDPGGDKCYHV
jgi:hypothetical protein